MKGTSYKLAFGGDHAGFELKEQIMEFARELGHTIKDFGSYGKESVDYPDYVHPLAAAVRNGEFDFGILICGSGIGVSIVANKHQDIRAANCWVEEIGKLSRQHNNANVLCLPARFVDVDTAKKIFQAFIETDFEGGRHADRVGKINLRC